MNSALRLHPCPGQISARSAEIEGQVVTVSASIRRRVEHVLVVENQLVKKGDLLVELDHREIDRKIAAFSAELDAAVVAPPLERKRYVLARLRRLHAEVLAPVDGRVIAIAPRPGELVGIAQPLVTILQSDDLWILARFYMDALDRVRTGQRAWVHAAGTVFTARVDSISHADGQVLLEFVESAVEPTAELRPGASAAVIVDLAHFAVASQQARFLVASAASERGVNRCSG